MKFSSIGNLSLLVAGSLPLLGWAAEPVDEAPSWTLKQVTRIIPNEGEVWLGFLISSEGYDPRWCYLLAHVDSPAKEASFVDSPCVGSGFTVSWGYKKEEDAGILSLANSKRTRIAWFGWNDINKSTVLADNGPNNTEATKMLADDTQAPAKEDDSQTLKEADGTQAPTKEDDSQTLKESDDTQTPAEADGTVEAQEGKADDKRPTYEEAVVNTEAAKEGAVDTMPTQEVADGTMRTQEVVDDKKPVAFVA